MGCPGCQEVAAQSRVVTEPHEPPSDSQGLQVVAAWGLTFGLIIMNTALPVLEV